MSNQHPFGDALPPVPRIESWAFQANPYLVDRVDKLERQLADCQAYLHETIKVYEKLEALYDHRPRRGPGCASTPLKYQGVAGFGEVVTRPVPLNMTEYSFDKTVAQKGWFALPNDRLADELEQTRVLYAKSLAERDRLIGRTAKLEKLQGNGHGSYLACLNGGYDGYQATCVTCDWVGPERPPGSEGKQQARRDLAAHG